MLSPYKTNRRLPLKAIQPKVILPKLKDAYYGCSNDKPLSSQDVLRALDTW